VPAEGSGGSSTDTFVGRAIALEQLRSSLALVLGGQPQVVFVTGEAGIGKTTLVSRFRNEVQSGRNWYVASGQCLEALGEAEAYLPMLEALGQLCRADPETMVAVLRRHAPTWLAQMPWLLTPEDRETLQHELEGATRERMLREFAETVETLAATKPVIVILEDLHWSDPSTIALLAFLAQRQRSCRLMLIATYRPVDAVVQAHPVRDLKQRLVLQKMCSEVTLSYLSAADIDAYLRHRLEGGIAADLPNVVHQRTNGNALFMVNFVDHLMSRHLLEQGSGGWHLTVSPQGIGTDVPEGLREMIDRQVEQLDAADVALLETASLAGSECSAALLAAVVQENPATVDERCEAIARRNQFLRLAGTAETPDGTLTNRYAFVHALYQNVLANRVAPARRQRCHRAMGDWLEAAHATPGELAYHYLRCGSPAGVRRAVECAEQAAQRARAVFAYEEAARHYETALNALAASDTADAARRCDLLLAHGEALERGGFISRSESSFLQAAELARELNNARNLARAALGLGRAYQRIGSIDQRLIALLEEALKRLGPQDDPLRARALARLDYALCAVPRSEQRRHQLGAEAVAMARRLDDTKTLVWVSQYTRWAFWGPQSVEEWRHGCEELAGLLARITDVEDRMYLHHLRMIDFLELGDVEAADAEMQKLEKLVDETRIPWFVWFLLRFKTMRALMDGRFADAERLAEETLQAGRRTDHPNVTPLFGVQMGILRLEKGETEELEPVVAQFVESNPNVVAWRCVLIYLRSALGYEEQARDGFETLAADDFADIPQDSVWLTAMAFVSLACVALGDRRRATVLMQLLEPYADRVCGVSSSIASLGHAGRYLGNLAALRSQWDVATSHFERAIAENRRMGALPWLAYTLADYAAMLRRRSKREAAKAAKLEREALDLARTLGMHGLSRHLADPE
jgi:tetratricopeptide (TPR) repeat protein